MGECFGMMVIMKTTRVGLFIVIMLMGVFTLSTLSSGYAQSSFFQKTCALIQINPVHDAAELSVSEYLRNANPNSKPHFLATVESAVREYIQQNQIDIKINGASSSSLGSGVKITSEIDLSGPNPIDMNHFDSDFADEYWDGLILTPIDC